MADKIYVEAGKRIRKLRKQQGYTEEILSEKANITRKFLQRIETGKAGFSAETLYKITKALNADCNYILMGTTSVSTEQAISETEDLLEYNYIALKYKIAQLRSALITGYEDEKTN